MKQFSTIKNFVKKYPDLVSEGGLRFWVFNSDINFFSVCIRRVGRRILLDEEAVFEWIDQQRAGGRHEK